MNIISETETSKVVQNKNAGTIKYYQKIDGKWELHRDGDLPALEDVKNGHQAWYSKGFLHRENDRPAQIFPNGEREWYKNGKLHRIKGPAVVYKHNGHQEWHLEGHEISEKEHQLAVAETAKTAETKIESFLGTQKTFRKFDGEWLLHSEQDRPAVIGDKGALIWYFKGRIHREGDLPAYTRDDGYQAWYQHGKIHRDGGKPAQVYGDGRKIWKVENKLHREDGPAIEDTDGHKEWFLNDKELSQEKWELAVGITKIGNIKGQKTYYRKFDGKWLIHRDFDLPAKDYRNGYQAWYQKGKIHREGDKPGVICADGDKFWYSNDVFHRTKGPAVEYNDGRQEWWLEGTELREEQWELAVGITKVEETDQSTCYYRKFDNEWKLHCTDGPAIVETHTGCERWFWEGKELSEEEWELVSGRTKIIVSADGLTTEYWHQIFGAHILHRDRDKPALLRVNGDKEWYSHGGLHRGNDKPAVELADGTKKWYRNAALHRENGKPAIIYPDGRKEWYVDGEQIFSKEKIQAMIKDADDTKAGTQQVLDTQIQILFSLLHTHGFQDEVFNELIKLFKLARS